MTEEWRLVVVDGLPGLETQAIYHAVAIAMERYDDIENTIIICWPSEPYVCIGYHQIVEEEVDTEYCKKNNIPIARRVLGGGAVLLDSNQLFYNIVAHIESEIVPRQIGDLYSKLLEPVVQTYRHFNIDAKYRPVNDILVRGRKISGNGAALLESAQVLVGNFILDFPRKDMTQILRVPSEKFRDKIYKSLEAGITSFSPATLLL